VVAEAGAGIDDRRLMVGKCPFEPFWLPFDVPVVIATGGVQAAAP
jgi:hypothetical protein